MKDIEAGIKNPLANYQKRGNRDVAGCPTGVHSVQEGPPSKKGLRNGQKKALLKGSERLREVWAKKTGCQSK